MLIKKFFSKVKLNNYWRIFFLILLCFSFFAIFLGNKEIKAAPLCDCVENSGCTGYCADPGTPSGSVPTINETSLGLSWTSVSGASYYTLKGVSGSTLNVTTTATSYTHSGLNPGTYYSYQVNACRTGCTLCITGGSGCLVNRGNDGYCTGNQTLCGDFSSTFGATTAFNAPSNLSCSAISQTQINISWTDNSGAESGYYIEQATGSCSDFSQIASVGANTVSYSNTGLSAGTTYCYRVRAYHSSGSTSSYSNTASCTTLPNPPAAPSNLSATPVSSSQINLSWTDNSSNETGFKVRGAQGTSCNSSSPVIATLGANTTSYSHTGLSANTTYCYVVCAYNTGGETCSSSATATTYPAYIDCGLRIFDGVNVVTIACEPLGILTSPLRIGKNGNIYGIVLVPTTDANATKIRIQTNSGLKSLRKY